MGAFLESPSPGPLRMQEVPGRGFSRADRFQPGLKHQNVPNMEMPVAIALEHFCPPLTHDLGVEVAFAAQPVFCQHLLGPVAQRSPKPLREGNGETSFWAVKHANWYISIQHLPQNPLALFF